MLYRPPRALGLLVGSVLTLWAVSTAVLLLSFGVRSEIGVVGFLAYAGATGAMLLAALFAYWSYGLATLSYELDRNALVVTYGLTEQVIPIGAIERLVPATEAGIPPVRGVTWWGCYIGSAHVDPIGQVLSYSTAQTPDQILYVITSERSYALTFEDPEDFARQVATRQELGPTAEVTHHVRHADFGLLSILGDRVAAGLAALAVAAGAIVWLQIALRYGSLPETIEVYFPPGQAPPLADFAGPAAILEVPQTATLVLIASLLAGVILHRWERVASRLVLAAAAALQAIFVAATAIAIA